MVGAFDGVYYHYYKFRLHLYEKTKIEHFIHGTRGLVFAPIALIFFVFNVSGLIYLFGFGLLILDTALEIIDIREEKTAREIFGGTPFGETLAHIIATLFRVLALGFIIIERPIGNVFELSTDLELIQNVPLVVIGSLFALFSFFGGIAHFIPVKTIAPPQFTKPISCYSKKCFGFFCATTE